MEIRFDCDRPTPRGTIVMFYLAGRAMTNGFDTIFDDDDCEITRSRVTGFDPDDSYCSYVEEKLPHWEEVVRELQSVIDDGGELYIEFFN